MTMKFPGTFENLQQSTARTDFAGEWRQRGKHYQFRATTGAVLNWWKSTGTIMFQGPWPAAKDLEAAFSNVTVIVEKERAVGTNAEHSLAQPYSKPTRFTGKMFASGGVKFAWFWGLLT